MKRTLLAGMVSALALASAAAADIKIAHIYGKTGPFEAYAKQSHDGLMLGLEYATGGTMEINGEPIVMIEKDTQLKPENGKALLEEAYGDDEVDLAIGPVSSGVALAMLPVAEEYEKILIVEPAVADSITGANWNRYIFRTSRNSSQDAVSSAIALAGDNVKIATLAQDYAFGRDGIAAFREALASQGIEIVHEEYAPTDTTDFTAAGERIFNAMKDLDGTKKLFVIWAGGGNPLGKIHAMDPGRFGIEFAGVGNILAALKGFKDYEGMEGGTYYYYELPDNPVNDWLVKTHFERFDSPPDFFTAGGMAAGIAAVEAIRKAGSTDTEELITAMEGMEWETPKGTMKFRAEDHQALQTMYHFKLTVQDGVEWAVPELVRELSIEEMPIPIRNQ
ncbi:MAG: ABC transporter permease [Roseobacter sp. MedPE-SWde]|uniref:substrate-binding domain-containing protein n=1 Tax=Roseobacter sp. MED193 TaxID=314262 RepID=UPI000068A611|nr:substrate-binding domain-containing protein [Roseobacter sp. MED193]EAQ43402.1 branched-chain amino acid ABC transporter, periplasmic branched-chain amino acid-binding protein [Roseobacter sp. MED193]OIQ38651.1 MAG: ABC transporter permease [Roseobacter sp. MedPE-SWde]